MNNENSHALIECYEIYSKLTRELETLKVKYQRQLEEQREKCQQSIKENEEEWQNKYQKLCD